MKGASPCPPTTHWSNGVLIYFPFTLKHILHLKRSPTTPGGERGLFDFPFLLICSYANCCQCQGSDELLKKRKTQWQVARRANSFIRRFSVARAFQTYVSGICRPINKSKLKLFLSSTGTFVLYKWSSVFGANRMGVRILYLLEAQQLKTNYKLIWIWISAWEGLIGTCDVLRRTICYIFIGELNTWRQRGEPRPKPK